MAAMTASELRDILIRELGKAHGGGMLRWRKVVGEVKVYPRSTHAHCNWDLRPAGSAEDVRKAEQAADMFRLRHPFVDD